MSLTSSGRHRAVTGQRNHSTLRMRPGRRARRWLGPRHRVLLLATSLMTSGATWIAVSTLWPLAT